MNHTWHVIPIRCDDGAELLAVVDAPEWITEWLTTSTGHIPAESIVLTLWPDEWRQARAMCAWRNGASEYAQWLEWSEAA